MSSTYAHYQGPSLLSDYAILSRYAGHHPDSEERIEGDEPSGNQSSDIASGIIRRGSIPPSQHRPQNPNMNTPFLHIPAPGPSPTENTPLLNPPIPQIDETLTDNSQDGSKMAKFWEELRILTIYALPVCG